MNRHGKNNRITAIAVLMILLLSLLPAGCRDGSDQVAGGDKVKYLIGVSQANLIEPWRILMNEEIKDEAVKHKDLRLIFTDAVQSSNKQIKDVEELLAQGIDLLIISPNDSAALTPIVAEAYKKIPVIVLDRAVEGYDYTLYIGPDNVLIGRDAGKLVAELLQKQGGNVIEIQGLSGSPPVRDRSEGFREVVGSTGHINILDTIIADWQRDKAEDKLAELIPRYPRIDVIFAQNDYMALGAYRATRKLGRKDVKVVGIDGFAGPTGGLKLVEEGILEGTFTCPTGGREAVQYAIAILNHERGIPKKIILRSNKMTRETIPEYLQAREGRQGNVSRTGGRIVVGFSQVGAESGWRIANSESIKQAAKDEGIELLFVEADQRQEKQIETIRSFIEQKVDVIAFAPVVATGWESILKEAKAAGIPVILSDRAVEGVDPSLYTTFIGGDFVEEGRRAARWLAAKTKGWPTVNIVELEGTIGSAPAIDRKKGFDEISKDHPAFKVLYSASGDFTEVQGKEAMQAALAIYGGDIQVVYAHNDDMALGAIQAIEEFGLKPGRDILVVSIDATRAAFKAMLEGKLNCAVECTPLLGPQLMQAVKWHMAGRQLPIRIITSEEVFPAELAAQEYSSRRY